MYKRCLWVSNSITSQCDTVYDVMLLLTHRTALIHFCYTVYDVMLCDPLTALIHFCDKSVMWCCSATASHHTVWQKYTRDVLWVTNGSHTLLTLCTMWCCGSATASHPQCDKSVREMFTVGDANPLHHIHFCHKSVRCDAVADPQNISRTLLCDKSVMWCR